MRELREVVADAMVSVPPQPDMNALALAEADAAITTFAALMRQPEVVTIFADAIADADWNGYMVREEYEEAAARAITAMLSAIGATEEPV